MKYFYLKIKIIKYNYKKYNKTNLFFLFFLISCYASGQTNQDTFPANVTLSQCITFALTNQELIKQSIIDEEITRRDIRIALSGWYPQLEVDGSLQHYFNIPTAPYPVYNYDTLSLKPHVIPSPITSSYTSSVLFSATQTLYSNALFFAARVSKNLKIHASENTESTKINTFVDVSRAFYDVLINEEQVNVLNEDIQRLERNYKDAYILYQDGIKDNIDYQRAEIDLSNSRAQKRSTVEAIKGKYAVLKHLMGVGPERQLTILYDSSKYENDILYDTTAHLDYNNRIEYKQLQTSLNLQNTQINYYKWSFLPTLSAFYNYNPLYENNQFSELFNTNYQSSLLGLKLSLPLFQGTSRLQNLSKSKLQFQRLQIGMDYLKSQISSDYTQALASYISNMNDLQIVKKNVLIAKNIYNTVKFQYDKGIKAYLEVIVSETDLRTSELNYLNLLFQVLTSKLELERTSGVIPISQYQK